MRIRILTQVAVVGDVAVIVQGVTAIAGDVAVQRLYTAKKYKNV